MTTVLLAQDAVGANSGAIPLGTQAAGYVTGPGVAWTAAQFAAHSRPYPAIEIDQDPAASVPTADVLDVEGGAAAPADAPRWVQAARADIAAKRRASQRVLPVIYCSANSIAPVTAALHGAGITGGVGMWLALPGESVTQATARITAAQGAFPCIGVQYAQDVNGKVDLSVFSETWVATMAGSLVTPPPRVNASPPGEWKDSAVMTGIGLDGLLFQTVFNPATNTWSKPVHI